MSWRHPERSIKDGTPIDPDDVNKAFKPFVDELGGRLNEHNFAEGAFNQDDFAEDMAVRTATINQYVDTSDGTTNPVPPPATYWGEDPDIFRVPLSDLWVPVDGLEKAITTPDGGADLDITFSCQTASGGHAGTTSPIPIIMQIGIEVDGVLVEESVSGSMDQLFEGRLFSFGTNGWLHPVQTSCNARVGEGEHVVRAMVRAYAASTQFPEGATVADSLAYVGSRTLTTVERAR